MTNNFDHLYAHAEALIYKKYTGEISVEEEVELNILLKRYPEFQSIQYEIDQLVSEKVLDATPIVYDSAIERLSYENHITSIQRKNTHRKWAATATVLLVLGAAVVFFISRQPSVPFIQDQQIMAGAIQLTTAEGKVVTLNKNQNIKTANGGLSFTKDSMLVSGNGTISGLNELRVPEKLEYTINLPDGSKVRLNSSTKLRFPFSFDVKKREIFVDGEAYFDIAPNTQQPFIVSTPFGSIEVLGTAFNVNTYQKDRLVTSLVSGTTIIHAENEHLKLTPGKQALVIKGKPIELQTFDPTTTLSWMDGIYYFDQTPLKEIASMIERWYGYKVVFDKQTLQEVQLTSHLDKRKPIQSFLTMLQNTNDIKSQIEGNFLRLR